MKNLVFGLLLASASFSLVASEVVETPAAEDRTVEATEAPAAEEPAAEVVAPVSE